MYIYICIYIYIYWQAEKKLSKSRLFDIIVDIYRSTAIPLF